SVSTAPAASRARSASCAAMARERSAAPRANGATAAGATSTHVRRWPRCEAAVGPAPRTRVLIAVAKENRERLQRLLDGHELIFVDNGSEARRLLENERFGLVLLGVHFDESQMFT